MRNSSRTNIISSSFYIIYTIRSRIQGRLSQSCYTYPFLRLCLFESPPLTVCSCLAPTHVCYLRQIFFFVHSLISLYGVVIREKLRQILIIRLTCLCMRCSRSAKCVSLQFHFASVYVTIQLFMPQSSVSRPLRK